jgi:hypothetical protein
MGWAGRTLERQDGDLKDGADDRRPEIKSVVLDCTVEDGLVYERPVLKTELTVEGRKQAQVSF